MGAIDGPRENPDWFERTIAGCPKNYKWGLFPNLFTADRLTALFTETMFCSSPRQRTPDPRGRCRSAAAAAGGPFPRSPVPPFPPPRTGHSSKVQNVAWNRDGSRLASGVPHNGDMEGGGGGSRGPRGRVRWHP